jgi:hypothetical protein
MTSPTPAAFATTDIITAVTSHALNLPAGASAGERILFAVGFATDPGTVTPPTGMTVERLLNQPSGGTAHLYSMIYEKQGSETTCTLTTSVAAKSATCSVYVTGDSTSIDAEISTGAVGVNGPPNPDLMTPTGGSKDYLFIAIGTMGGETAMTAAPTNYTNFQEADTGTAGAITVNERTGIGTRQLTAASDDPGVFTGGDATQEWVGMTAAFHPAGGAVDATATPSTVAAVAGVPAPTILAAAITAVTTAAALVAVPAPTVLGSSVVQPSTLAALADVPAPTIIAVSPDATATPATVAALGAIPAPTLAASAKTLLHPTNLVATPISISEIDLEWIASVGASSYDIERDGVVIVTGHVGTTYQDTGLAQDTQYRYRVGAKV